MPAFLKYRDVGYSGGGGCGGGLLVSAPPVSDHAALFTTRRRNQSFDTLFSPRKRSRVTAPLFVLIAGDEATAKPAQAPPPSLDELPDECLFEILRRLQGPQERSSSACVSKRWLDLLSSIRSSELKQEPTLSCLNKKAVAEMGADSESVDRSLESKEATDTRLAAMAVAGAHRGGLQMLSVRGSHPIRGVTDRGVSAVGRCCPSLRALSLWDVPLVTDAGLMEIADGCPELEKLDLTQCPLVTDKGLVAIAQKCPNLSSLAVELCAGIQNEGLMAIGRLCPKLKAVVIKNCPLVGDQGVASLVCSATSSLAKIRLQGLSITDTSLAVIGLHGKAVTELSLSRLPAVGERGFWVMANARGLQKLRILNVTSCPGVTDVSLASIGKFCPSLKQLFLKKCQVGDLGLKSFVEMGKVLESLQLEDCSGVTLIGVLAGLLNCSPKFKTLALVKCLGIKDIAAVPAQLPVCKSLRSLTISECPGFTDASFAVVGMICPQLENVKLTGLSAVTDRGLLPLIKSSEKGMVKVDLSGCRNLTDAAISALVKAHGTTLEQLSLDGCKNLTDASLFAIADSCSKLAELDLSDCMISDYGVAILASAKQLKLRVLSLSGCSKVTQKSVPFLGNMGESLEGLNVQFCNLNHGVESLEENLWWCDILA